MTAGEEQIGDFKVHADPVKFDVGRVIDRFAERFRVQEEGVPEALHVGRNMQSIATYYDFLSAEPKLQEVYGYFLNCAVYGEVKWANTLTITNVLTAMGTAAVPFPAANINPAALALAAPAVAGVFPPGAFALRPGANAAGTPRFASFADMIAWLQGFIKGAMRPEFTMKDHEFLLRLYLGQMRSSSGVAGTYFEPRSEQVGDGRMLTPADTAGEYLTPESNFLASAPWTGRPQENRAHGFFRGVSDAFAFFYDEKGQVMDMLLETTETGTAATTGRQRARVEIMDDQVQGEPVDHHHYTHESFPFAQKQWRTKYEDAVRMEPMPWERAARIVFLAAPVRYQVGATSCQLTRSRRSMP